jgi:hypothetical protein
VAAVAHEAVDDLAGLVENFDFDFVAVGVGGGLGLGGIGEGGVRGSDAGRGAHYERAQG